MNRGLLSRVEGWASSANRLLVVVVVAFTLVSLAALIVTLVDPLGRTAAIADARVRTALQIQCELNSESIEQLNIREKWFHSATDLAGVLAETGVAQTPAGLAERARLARRLREFDRLVLPIAVPNCDDVLGEG